LVDKYVNADYFKGLLAITEKYLVWNSNVVVEEILYKGIMARYPVRELLIGLDCKYLLGGLMRMLPSYIIEPLLYLQRPTPACMLKEPQPATTKTK
jgi:hypothetical protein